MLAYGWFDLSVSWGLVSEALVGLVMLAFFVQFQDTAARSKEIALVALLGTLSAVLRIPSTPYPASSPAPTWSFAAGTCSARCRGPWWGPWTPLQMVAWGLAGVSAGYLRRFNLNRTSLTVPGVVWGYLFGLSMDSWFWAGRSSQPRSAACGSMLFTPSATPSSRASSGSRP